MNINKTSRPPLGLMNIHNSPPFFFSRQAASKPTAARDIAEHTMSILNEALAVPLRTPRTARDASRVAGVV